MKRTVIYIHGQGGGADEAAHYQSLFEDCEVIGFDYHAQTPWEAESEFPAFLAPLTASGKKITLIANSIGAYFAMHALSERQVEKAFFISPVVDMEKLILNMMHNAKVTEKDLQKIGRILIPSGQTLSWEYLSYVRTHPIEWTVPTHLLYGANDVLIPYSHIRAFADATGASLTVLENGEHWFHTEEQMAFLDRWIKSKL